MGYLVKLDTLQAKAHGLSSNSGAEIEKPT